MVMEVPNPQIVGREFVRQYYTILNKAPIYLHRFYSDNSTFTHGGFDQPGQETKPVVGQQEIHDKIMELSFQDCHAKIRQVDSHQTLENAVVVQVAGELSNNGKPMRKFVQTFVLAPQSPKKFYVRNDIFRYQDEGYPEEDTQESIINDDVAPPSEEPVVTTVENHHEPPPPQSNYYEQQQPPTHEETPVRNGTIQDVVQPPPPPESPKSNEWEDTPLEVTPSQPEHKTYANMVSKSAGGTSNSGPPSTSPVSPVQHPPPPVSKPMDHPPPPIQNKSSSFEDDNIDRRRMSTAPQYPDNQQLFVGNLTHSITEEDLREHFARYGNVLETRINKQSPQKMGNKVPNFGFIVFEDPECVAKVLKDKPIYFNSHRLNVEEKKNKPRGGLGNEGGGRGRGGPLNSRGSMAPGGRGISRGRPSYGTRR